MKREIPVEAAVGMVLAHDLTQIVPGEKKGVLFRKGHVVQETDIPSLLSIGKRYIYALSLEQGEIHEDDAARKMVACVIHDSLIPTDPHEGKITLKAAHAGLLIVDVDAIRLLNQIGELVVVTKRTWSPVAAGDPVAALRAIPLIIREELLERFAAIAQRQAVLRVAPYRSLAVGVVTTGSEVFSGRIQDRFKPVLEAKVAAYGLRFWGQTIVDDEQVHIVQAIREWLERGVDLVLVTGGMSVDPDDRSPAAIRAVADEVVTHGMPVLPGSMTMLAYAGQAAVMGLPGCVIFDEVTVFDWLLPRLAAGLRPDRAEIAELGHGGLM